MLGPLQSRRATICAVACDWFQALEREETAAKLQKALVATGKKLNVLIQVKAGDEPTKHGIEAKAIDALAGELAQIDRLVLRGLMCIPPGPNYYSSKAAWEVGTRTAFRQMAALFARMQTGCAELPLDTLSMGMSADYRWAIEEGATMVRIGSALFEGLR
jgi:pyridoxal phosphate enzyme (YggS family)